MTNPLILLITIAFIAALANLFLPVLVRKITTLLVILFNIWITYFLFSNSNDIWAFNNETILSLDKMGLMTLVFIQLMSLVVFLFSIKGIDAATEKAFFVLYPLTVGFCNGVVLSEHAFAFMVFWGLSGLSLYLFANLGKKPESPKTAKKTFIIMGGSDVFLLMGLVMMWYVSPYTGWSLKKPEITLDGNLEYTAFVMLLIAALTKAGGFPFHTWVPDFCRDAPVESAAFLPASLDKLLGIYLLSKILTTYFVLGELIYMIVITLGAITVITAVMMALIQHNGRKLLGYHAVSQVGYMIMGIGSGNIVAFAGGLFHMLNNTIYKSALFLSLGSVEKRTGTNELDYLGGLGKVMPYTFISALVAALSISGIPPFNGFFSKWMIYQGLLEKTAAVSHGYQVWLLICIITALFGSALTLASFMKFIHAIFLGRRPSVYDNVTEAPSNQVISSVILAVLCIVFGIGAMGIPLKYLVIPAAFNQMPGTPYLIGFYNPGLLLTLFLLGAVAGLIIYLAVRRIRYDDIYVGGMPPLEQYRISGTEFYREIRNFTLLKSLYNAAEKELFDVYEVGKEFTLKLSKGFQLAHPGLLQIYILFITIGTLLLIMLL